MSLLPDLTVADNIAITNPPKRMGFIDTAEQYRVAEKLLARVGGHDIHPDAPVGELPLSRRQIVEIAKALARNPKILILDEATSALTAADVARVFAMLKQLRDNGLAIIYISHRMHEVAELADDCTVFRNGRFVESFQAGTKWPRAVLDRRPVQFLYSDESDYHFMDLDTYDQFALSSGQLGEAVQYLKDGMTLDRTSYQGETIGVELPITVDLAVQTTEPGFAGDTAQGARKPATLETGLVVQVPAFIGEGELIRIDTATGAYIERVK